MYFSGETPYIFLNVAEKCAGDEKFKSFGFQIINIDGHDIQEIMDAFEVAKKVKENPDNVRETDNLITALSFAKKERDT